jgi:hypothetical protein
MEGSTCICALLSTAFRSPLILIIFTISTFTSEIKPLSADGTIRMASTVHGQIPVDFVWGNWDRRAIRKQASPATMFK